MMRTVSPAPIAPSNTWPAASCPITSSVTGARRRLRRVQRTAYPSIALLANGEMSISATASSAKGRPAACHAGISTTSVRFRRASNDRLCVLQRNEYLCHIHPFYMQRRTSRAPILYVYLSIIPRRLLKTWPATANTPVGNGRRNRAETNLPVLSRLARSIMLVLQPKRGTYGFYRQNRKRKRNAGFISQPLDDGRLFS